MTRRLRLISFGVCYAALALGFGLGGQLAWAVLWAVGGAAGLVLLYKSKLELGQAGFLLGVGGAAWGIWQGLPAWALVLALGAALAFWDLDAFLERLRAVGAVESPEAAAALRALERAHMRQLAWALGIGMALCAAGFWVKLELSLGWAIFLGVVVIAAIRLGVAAFEPRPEKAKP